MTYAERLLWSKIRGKQLEDHQFYRQRIIGNYIADFYCPKAKLVIELDGGQHYSDKGLEKDKIRDAYLSGQGLKVLRFSDRDVFENITGVIDSIREYVIPLYPPLEKGEYVKSASYEMGKFCLQQ